MQSGWRRPLVSEEAELALCIILMNVPYLEFTMAAG